jgi:ABC-type transporter Mla subunit MlaD
MPVQSRNMFKLGLAVILMVVLAFASVLFISGQDLFKPPQTRLHVLFPSYAGMPGLDKGAFVHYLGQKVGTVSRLQFVENKAGDHYLEITAEVRADLGLRSDCQVTLAGPVLGGTGTVEIVHRGKQGQPLDPQSRILGTVSSFQSAVERFSLELDDSNPHGILSRIKRQLDPDNDAGVIYRVNQTLENVRGATASAREEMDRKLPETLMARIHAGLATIIGILEENREPLRDGIAHGRDALGHGEHFMGSLAREFEMDRTPATSLLAKAHDAMDCLGSSMASLTATASDARTTVAVNKGHVTEILGNLDAASHDIKQLTQSILLNPWWLFEKPSTAEKRERVLFSVARAYADAAARLDVTTERLKSLLESRDARIPADDPDLVQIREDLTVTVERFTAAERALLQEFQIPPQAAPGP